MEEEDGFDHMEEGGFLELLGSGGEQGGYLFDAPSSLSSPSSSCYSSLTAAQMLCFGGKEEAALAPHGALAQRSADNSSISSLSSSPNSTATTTTTTTTTININSGSSKTSKKKAGSGGGGGGRRTASVTTTSTTLNANKKPKTEACASAGHGAIKVRKEKLGDRIMALQQLVSPFGKSDTASVLHEAMGYIRFLHDQVQVLSSPYLQGMSSSDHIQDGRGNDLRSRGLCLVPISCTEHVTNSNGADLWSPAMGGVGTLTEEKGS
ncbi:transcription factor bHLH113-like isoform X3 [Musa acuminata AAA Group]|uniref:transcription factor bHLH113 isoform X3 n=1 Tax=Musa acuminata AAA Group TaxID=214697 RepID=UPI0031D2B08E